MKDSAKLIFESSEKQIYKDGKNLIKVFGEGYSKAEVLKAASTSPKFTP